MRNPLTFNSHKVTYFESKRLLTYAKASIYAKAPIDKSSGRIISFGSTIPVLNVFALTLNTLSASGSAISPKQANKAIINPETNYKNMPAAFLYKTLTDKNIVCAACCHRCRIPPGKIGVCGVRKNTNGRLELLVFGKAAAVNIDPIEKKPLYHFMPGSKTFSIGTVGCNFRCLNCHNYNLSQISNYNSQISEYSKIAFGQTLSPTDAVQAAKINDCQSIAYTYNEPTVWAEYALETMKLAKRAGLNNIWVSNGFMTPETLAAISPYLDAINIDIKSFSDKFYRENCSARLAPVLENCEKIKTQKIHLEITTLIIPTLSDDEKMLAELANFIHQKLGADTPWHISAFSGEISWKLPHLPPTSLEQLKKIYQIGRMQGLHYVYAGNISADGLENTYCPNCQTMAIKRSGYNIKNNLLNGQCQECGYQIEGYFLVPRGTRKQNIP